MNATEKKEESNCKSSLARFRSSEDEFKHLLSFDFRPPPQPQQDRRTSPPQLRPPNPLPLPILYHLPRLPPHRHAPTPFPIPTTLHQVPTSSRLLPINNVRPPSSSRLEEARFRMVRRGGEGSVEDGNCTTRKYEGTGEGGMDGGSSESGVRVGAGADQNGGNDEDASSPPHPRQLPAQHLFNITNLTHQTTISRFLCGQHDLRAVYYQQRTKRRARRERSERVCRHGCNAVEDERHLMRCTKAGVVEARKLMMGEARKAGWVEESREEQEEDGNRGEEEIRADEDTFLLSSLIRHPKCFRIVSRFCKDP